MEPSEAATNGIVRRQNDVATPPTVRFPPFQLSADHTLHRRSEFKSKIEGRVCFGDVAVAFLKTEPPRADGHFGSFLLLDPWRSDIDATKLWNTSPGPMWHERRPCLEVFGWVALVVGAGVLVAVAVAVFVMQRAIAAATNFPEKWSRSAT